MKYGINGKLSYVIKVMYSDLKSCVKMHGHVSEYISSKTGLVQGEVLSPMLFSLFINVLEKEMVANCCNSLELQDLNLFLLLYADDTVIFSESVAGLQKMFDTLNFYTTQSGNLRLM